MAISEDMTTLLVRLAEYEHRRVTDAAIPRGSFSTETISELLSMPSNRLNTALDLLEQAGLVSLDRSLAKWPHRSNGITITPQGLLAAEQSGRTEASSPTTRQAVDKRAVFVVHGRNKKVRDAIFAFLREIDLNPIEWEEAVALTGKSSPFVGEILDAAFSHAQAIVVVLTGDDEARLRAEYREGDESVQESNLLPQARPNVLFEAGMALARSPDRTVILEFGELRPFSDIAGRHTIRLASGSAPERHRIAGRLKTAGCAVNTAGRTQWIESEALARCFDEDP